MARREGRPRRSHGEPDCMGLYEGGPCELCLFRRECRLRAWEVEEARERAALSDARRGFDYQGSGS